VDLLVAGVVTLLALIVGGRIWQQRHPDLTAYNRLPTHTQRRVAASVYTGGALPATDEKGVAPEELDAAVRGFTAGARRWTRPGPTIALALAATAVFLATSALARGGLETEQLVLVAPFWVAVLPAVLRWQELRRRALEGDEPSGPPLWRVAPVRFLLVFALSWVPLTVLLTNLTMMVEAATGLDSQGLTAGVHGGLAVGYLVWVAPTRTVRGAVRVFLGWLAVLLLAAGLLALTGVRPTDAL
jgi:hypothetical protein